MLEVSNLVKRFNRIPAVDGVSFTIHRGEILGYLGPNGAGKSTTVKMLVGLMEPTEGRILFHGEDVRHNRIEFQRRLGYVPEEPNLYPHLTGREYLQLIRRGAASWDNSRSFSGVGAGRIERNRLHHHPRLGLLHALDDNLFPGFQSIGDNPFVPHGLADFDRPDGHLAVGIHHQHGGGAAGADVDAALRHGDGVGIDRLFQHFW